LSLFAVEAPFRFSGMKDCSPKVVHADVLRDAQLVAEGKGDGVLDLVMHWAENVRVRALQDLALHHPSLFRSCWASTEPEQWTDHSQLWGKCLRVREDFDIGWVSDEAAPKWASRVSDTRRQIKELVHFLDMAIEDDDKAAWTTELGSIVPSESAQHEVELQGLLQIEGSGPAAQDVVFYDASKSEGPLDVSQLALPLVIDDIQTQDLDINVLHAADTPMNGVSIIGSSGGQDQHVVDLVLSTPRSLEETFQAIINTPDDPYALPEADSSEGELEPAVEVEVLLEEVEGPTSLRHRKSVTFEPLPILERSTKAWDRLSIARTYTTFQMEELIQALPRYMLALSLLVLFMF
jgi:hypothetical protein